ncbi:MAG: hypothetical protein PHX08_08705 [Lachnospiraceae bacterium]|nr:hypothetical protein [Lachnospiraceae bacterium]
MTKDIFIDTDCISAFLWVGNESLLSQLYPGRVVMPKPVYDEIDRPSLAWMKARVDSMISSGKLVVVDLTSGTEEFEMYYKLTENPDEGHKIIGDGEASSIALAKTRNGIVASNNFNDILTYIHEYSLEYTTTADILVDAYKRGLIDENWGNTIWSNMLKKRRRLGAASFSDYLNTHSQ